jgi:chemotaxis-related protein WspB
MLALLFQIGASRFALDARHVKEVVPRVGLQALACSPSWVAGVFVFRGQVVSVLDLHRLLGAGDCPHCLSSRIILMPYPPDQAGRLLGLLATQVAELREIDAAGQVLPYQTPSAEPNLGPVLADKEGILHLLDVNRLLSDAMRSELLALPLKGSP